MRAVDSVLRASLLELLMGRPQSSTPQAADGPVILQDVRQKASHWAEKAITKERPSQWGIEVGAALIDSPEGIGPAVLSVGRLRYAPL